MPTLDGVPQFAPTLADTISGFDSDAFAELANLEAGHFWFEARNRLITGLSRKYFPGASSYMEIGCGTGFVLAAMARSRPWARVVGSEIHLKGLSHARTRPGARAEFVQMDARAIPARHAFDLIGAFDVLEHIEADEAVMHEVHSVLVPRGGFMIAVPQHPWLWSKIDQHSHHVRRYRRGEAERKLETAGFEILFSTSYATVLVPFVLARRLSASGEADSEGLRRTVQRELRPHPFLNNALRAVLEVEVSLSLRGLKWPMGGSRVMVARKRA